MSLGSSTATIFETTMSSNQENSPKKDGLEETALDAFQNITDPAGISLRYQIMNLRTHFSNDL